MALGLGTTNRRSGAAAAVAVLFGLLVASLANAQTTSVPQTQSGELSVVDARPAEDRSTETLSFWIWSCDYGVARLGEEDERPSRLSVLADDLKSALGKKLNGQSIKITRYRVFLNESARARKGVNAFAGGYAGAAGTMVSAAFQGSNCSKEKSGGGWYSGAEVTTPFSPFIVEISADFNEKEYDARAVVSPKLDLKGKFCRLERVNGVYCDPDAQSAYAEALHTANVALATELKDAKTLNRSATPAAAAD